MLKDKVLQITRYEKIKALFVKYERLLMPATLIFGFVVDAFTFKAIDIWSAFILLGVHVFLAGSAIAYINIYDAGKIKGLGRKMIYVRYGRLFAPYLLQMSFGALLSAAFIFYLFGSAVGISWPLLFFILLLALSNEIFKEYYLRPALQISVYFFAIFTVLALIFPFVFKSISVWWFIWAGVASLIIITIYINILSRIVQSLVEQKIVFKFCAVIIFVLMNIFYYYNIIPPVPLSLSDEGVYHNITHQGDVYRLVQERESLWQRLVPGQTIHIKQSDPVYIFSAIRAPSELNTRIIHHWQWYDPIQQEWADEDLLHFYILGGRRDGYRGYSFKTVLSPGKWRVDVETENGRVFGRVRFDVARVESNVETEILVR